MTAQHTVQRNIQNKSGEAYCLANGDAGLFVHGKQRKRDGFRKQRILNDLGASRVAAGDDLRHSQSPENRLRVARGRVHDSRAHQDVCATQRRDNIANNPNFTTAELDAARSGKGEGRNS